MLHSWLVRTCLFQALPAFVSTDFLDAIHAIQTDMLFYNEVTIKFVQIQSDMKSIINAMTSKRIQVAFAYFPNATAKSEYKLTLPERLPQPPCYTNKTDFINSKIAFFQSRFRSIKIEIMAMK